MRSERRKRRSLALTSNWRRCGTGRAAAFCGCWAAGTRALVIAPGWVRLTNPITASRETRISKPAARAFSRHASTRASSPTAAAMASDSSLAIRFTTSSIRDLLSDERDKRDERDERDERADLATGAGIPGH